MFAGGQSQHTAGGRSGEEDRSEAVILSREEWARSAQGKIIAGEVVPDFGFRLSLPVREAAGGQITSGRIIAAPVYRCAARQCWRVHNPFCHTWGFRQSRMRQHAAGWSYASRKSGQDGRKWLVAAAVPASWRGPIATPALGALHLSKRSVRHGGTRMRIKSQPASRANASPIS
jgi:hypothetical protein